jgi:hypothetical protein
MSSGWRSIAVPFQRGGPNLDLEGGIALVSDIIADALALHSPKPIP